MRKIGQNEAFQEEKYNDKNIIHLPRQVTKIVLKTFENQEFFQNPTWIYDTFTTDEVKLW